MAVPNNEQVTHLAVELIGATATELLLARIARRLTKGRARPSRRYVRRMAGAVLSELVAEGLADLYWQRRRFRAEVDRKLIEARVGARHRQPPVIPSQRSAPAQERAVELAPTRTA